MNVIFKKGNICCARYLVHTHSPYSFRRCFCFYVTSSKSFFSNAFSQTHFLIHFSSSSSTSTMENENEHRQCIRDIRDEGSIESIRYYQCRKTVLEMLNDRGYDVPHSDLTLSLSDFRSLFGQQPKPENLAFSVSLRSNPFNKVQVAFTGTDDIKKATINNIYNQIVDKERLSRLILIVQSKMTAYARKELENCRFKVEMIQMNDLLVNITKHVLQPKYEILTTAEKNELLKKYNMEDKQLPHILTTDAIARYYGLEKGQVIKITYSGDVVNSLVTYRCVV